MFCPFCLHNTNTEKCSNCGEVLPPLYLQTHKSVKKKAIFSAVGFSGHGKTVYLATLFSEMNNRLPNIWPGFFRQGLNLDSVNTVNENVKMLEKGNLPDSTRLNFPKPSIHTLKPIPHYKSANLIIYDPPGEAFDSDTGIESYAHFVKNVSCVVFLVSIADLEEPKNLEINRLLEIYYLGLGKLTAKPKKQHLIVALTKADLLIDLFENYPAVIDHLSQPDLSALKNPREYSRKLQVVSTEIEKFFIEELKATSFISMAKNRFCSVNYCVVSALGNAPEDGHLSGKIQPAAVIDPLVWVLEKN